MKIIKLMLFVSLFALSFGGKNAEASLSFSVKGGGTLSKINNSNITPAPANSSTKNYLYGAGIDFDLGPVGVMTEFFWTNRTYESAPGTSYYTVPTLYIPVQAKYTVIPFLYVTAGAFYSRVFTDTLEVFLTADDTLFGVLTLDQAEASKNDFGAVFGVGTSIPVGFTTLTAELRYNLGLFNVSTGTTVAKTTNIDLLIGASF